MNKLIDITCNIIFGTALLLTASGIGMGLYVFLTASW